jgi:hypothetical protein
MKRAAIKQLVAWALRRAKHSVSVGNVTCYIDEFKNNRRAYFLAEAMIAIIIAGSIATVYVSMSYYTNIQANLMKYQNTKTILDVIRSRIIHDAQDPDSDNYFEPLKEDGSSELPASIGLGVDAWGKRIKYTTFDFNDSNIDPNYANTTDQISPNSEVAARLLSSGENLSFETDENNATAQGDDLLLEITTSEINHYKLYGGKVLNFNTAVVSATEPTLEIDGTLWYDTNASKLKIYSKADNNWSEI